MQCKNNVREKEQRPKGEGQKEKKDPNKVPQTSSCLKITHSKWRGRGSEKLGWSIHWQLWGTSLWGFHNRNTLTCAWLHVYMMNVTVCFSSNLSWGSYLNVHYEATHDDIHVSAFCSGSCSQVFGWCVDIFHFCPLKALTGGKLSKCITCLQIKCLPLPCPNREQEALQTS